MSSAAVAALSFAMVGVGPAMAAESVESAEERATTVDDLIVTAQRREQSAQDVGIALSVVGGAQLEELNITVVNDLENAVPNLEVDSQFGSGQPQFRIRGVGAREYSANNASTVGVYVDEVAYPYTVASQGVLFDIARLEVLRGPQGTLYGRNTTGGAVNIITNKPTRDFTAGLTAEYGRFDAVKAEGYVSGQLAPNLTGRLAASIERGGAWQYHRDTGESLGDARKTAIRGRLLWDATHNTSVDVIAHWYRDESDGLGFRLLAPYQTGKATVPPSGPLYPADTAWRITGWGISPQLAAIAGVSTSAKPFRDNEGVGLSATVRSDLGFAQLTSVTAYEQFDRKEFNDWDATASNEGDTYFYNEIEVFSQELRLNGTTGQADWLVGASYSSEANDGGFFSDFTDAFGPSYLFDTRYDQSVESIGVFGNLNYRVTEQFSIVGGLRYEDETRKLENFRTKRITLPPTSPPFDTESTLSEVSGRLGVEYKVNDDLLLYANVARGVKSGGFTTYNKTSASDEQAKPFRPEILWAYEAGFKSQFLDRRLRLNGAAFYYDYTDQQVQGYVVDPLFGRIGKIANVPESHIYGAELELAWRVTRGLEITQYLGYKYGEYDVYESLDWPATQAARDPITQLYNTVITTSLAGDRLPFPRVNYGGQVSYEWTAADYDLRVETNYSHRSDLYSTSAASIIPSYWLANASFSLGPKDGNWQAAFWARNIFDKYYEETRNAWNGNSYGVTTSPHQPRTYGVRLTYKY